MQELTGPEPDQARHVAPATDDDDDDKAHRIVTTSPLRKKVAYLTYPTIEIEDILAAVAAPPAAPRP